MRQEMFAENITLMLNESLLGRTKEVSQFISVIITILAMLYIFYGFYKYQSRNPLKFK